MAKDKRAKTDRVFNDHIGRHYRRRYSRREVWAGAVIAVGMAGVGGWVAWRGANPDPALFEAAPGMTRRGPADVARGVLPEGVAPSGWTEGGVATFGPDNVYEKINGREGFYKSFGFVSLAFASYFDPEDETRAVDVEIYDLGAPANALGCLSAESGPDRPPEVMDGGLVRVESNARFLTRGRHYLRLVASDASPRSTAALEHLQGRLVASLAGDALPWSFALLVGQLGLPTSGVSYYAEDAFSLAAGQRVHAGAIDGEGAVVFVSVDGDPEARAAALMSGFSLLGEPEEAGGRVWVRDQFQSRLSTAVVAPPFVAGVYSAAELEGGEEALEALLSALEAMPDTVREGARQELSDSLDAAAPAEKTEDEEYGGDDEEYGEEY